MKAQPVLVGEVAPASAQKASCQANVASVNSIPDKMRAYLVTYRLPLCPLRAFAACVFIARMLPT